ncbi:MAG: putative rane protein [Pseudonocardiales bacterium]|nr:putative rane protein [Pseudonocardiales bacterium]
MLTIAASLVFWLGGVWRVPSAISEPQKRPLCLGLLAFGIGAMFDVPSVSSTFDRAVDITNLSDLIAHGLGLIGIYFLMVSLDGLVTSAPPDGTADIERSISSRWLLPCLMAALVSSALLFAATPMRHETSAFTADYGQHPTIAAYWAISILFPVLCLLQLSRTIVVHWSSPSTALGRGLKVCGVGVLFGYGYAGVKLAELISAREGRNLAARWRSVDHGLLGLGLLLIAVGLGSPTVVTRMRPRVDRYRVRRSLRRLDWIWTKFCVEAGAAAVIREGPPEFLLVRRVVETRDGQAVLWSYLAADDLADVRYRLRALGKEPTDSPVEASALALALKRELTGADRGRRENEPHVPRLVAGGRTMLDLDAEVAELVNLGSRIRRVLA